ncbi:MAG: FtsW/RodA/SpoVE family cell cycle protein [Bacteroidales bacterium]|nr:FtsW/RodA/SpoVE family cell cycle protein [Bacteroidales bacterium]
MGEKINKYLKGDPIIWGVIIVLSIFSLLAVYSATSTLAMHKMGGNSLYYLIRHGVILAFGIMIIFITHLIHYKYYSRLSQLLIGIAVVLLIITLFLGTNVNQATRWLTLPGLGFTIQTSDFAKLALIMYIARVLSMKQGEIKSFKEAFLPVIIPVVIICVLILPANLSTAALVFVISFLLMFIGRISIKHLLASGGVAVLLLALFITVGTLVKKEGRINTWKNRIENYFEEGGGENYQSQQAKIAIATGGLFGKNPGKSVQRNFLPNPYSDFIYAIIVEEYGLIIGGIPILLAYLFLLFRAGVIVRKCDRTFPAFLAIGLTLMIVVQAMVNMSVAVGIFPVTGQTLPLVSMGGSSMLFTSIAFGIILSISRNLNETEPDEEEVTA